MKLLTRMIRILFVLAIVLAPGANLQPVSAQPDAAALSLPHGGDELYKTNLALGPNGWLYAEAVAPNGDIYVGGDSTAIGGSFTGLVARWGASDHQWHALGGDITWGRVESLAISGNYLYVGGYYDAVNGTAIIANGIARWNMTTNTWSQVGGSGLTPTNGDVYGLAVDSSGNVYAGGSFTAINGVTAMNVAKWNGSAWSAMGAGVGIAGEKVYTLLWHANTLFAGGSFITLKHIAYFNTSPASAAWATLGGGANQTVYALAADSNALYAGGSFDQVTNGSTHIPVGYIAQYLWAAGGSWQDMNQGFCCADVDSLAIGPDGLVYAGGRFSKTADPSGTTTSNLAYWKSGAWHPIAATGSFYDGVSGNLYGLLFSGQDLWMVGGFVYAGDYSANYVARYNLTDKKFYFPGGNAPNGTIHAVVVNFPDIYYGGAFDTAGGIQTIGVARYNVLTNTWSTLGTGVSGCNGLCAMPVVNTMLLAGSYLYVGGNFTSAGGVAVNNLARFNLNTHTWSDVGGGLTNCPSFLCSTTVNALAYDGSLVYVGGYFQTAGGSVTVNNIAAWNGTHWSALYDSSLSRLGVDSEVKAIAVSSNVLTTDIYVGGSFTSPGSKIARWDGTNWHAIGTATFDGAVNAIDVLGGSIFGNGSVYIGGSFTTAGGSPTSYLARLSGSSWVTVGAALDGAVDSLADNGAQLVVGGEFRYEGANYMEHVGIWSGSAWNMMGNGVFSNGTSNAPTVAAIAINGGYVYLGGSFRAAGPNMPLSSSAYPSDNIAIWGGYRSYLPMMKH